MKFRPFAKTKEERESISKDILYKAAEDVQRGLWCRGNWFLGEDGEEMRSWDQQAYTWLDDDQQEALFETEFSYIEEDDIRRTLPMEERLEWLSRSKKCAEGSIFFAAMFLGYGRDQAEHAVRMVEEHGEVPVRFGSLIDYNDSGLPNNIFDAGSILAEHFRKAADSL